MLPGRTSTTATAAASFALVVGISLIDYATGIELRVYPLYFLPIALVALRAGQRFTAVISMASALGWMLSNLTAGQHHSSRMWVVNTAVQAVGFGVVGHMIASLRASQRRERELSRTDALTGLMNTRAFHDDANRLLSQARRHGRPLTLAYLDLDNFKRVNDTLGHAAGDEVLRAVAASFRSSVRAEDLVARMGGDEFALMLPDTEAAGAQRVLDRLRTETTRAMAATPWVTLSIGAVSFTEPPETIAELLGSADALMYTAKREGKNALRIQSGAAVPEMVA